MDAFAQLPDEINHLVSEFHSIPVVGDLMMGLTQYTFWLCASAILLLVLMLVFVKKLTLVPHGTFMNLMEWGISFVKDDVCQQIIGKNWKKHFPFLATLFFFILANNVVGVIPGMKPGSGTISTMIFTWVKNKKPDVSMTLNGSLAGLVAITAGCATVDIVGAFFIGVVAGILVVVAVEVIDKVFHVDDPVGAIAVHGCNGLWGTIACGLFSTSTGLFYTGSFAQLGVQLIGIIAIAAWTIFCMVILFNILKHTVGLRASRVEEIEGLDKHEHGLPSAYADFTPVPLAAEIIEAEGLPANLAASEPAGVTVTDTTAPEMPSVSASDGIAKLSKVVILTKQSKFEDLKQALNAIGVTGITVTQVLGCGVQKGASEYYRGVKLDMDLLPKVKVEVVVSKVPVAEVVSAARKALYTGHIGDGKIFVYDVEDVVRVRTGESGYNALQDEED